MKQLFLHSQLCRKYLVSYFQYRIHPHAQVHTNLNDFVHILVLYLLTTHHVCFQTHFLKDIKLQADTNHHHSNSYILVDYILKQTSRNISPHPQL